MNFNYIIKPFGSKANVFIRNQWSESSNDDFNLLRLGKSVHRCRSEYKLDLFGFSLVYLVRHKNE